MAYEDLIKAYYTTFRQSESGTVVLEDLKNKFYRRVISTKDTTELMVNVGMHDAVVYIISMIEDYELKQRPRSKSNG